MAPKLQVEESLAFLFTCIAASGVKLDFKTIGDVAGLQPAAARMRYSRLKKAVENGTFRNATMVTPGDPIVDAAMTAVSDKSGLTSNRPRKRRKKQGVEDEASSLSEEDVFSTYKSRAKHSRSTRETGSAREDYAEVEVDHEGARRSPYEKRDKDKFVKDSKIGCSTTTIASNHCRIQEYLPTGQLDDMHKLGLIAPATPLSLPTGSLKSSRSYNTTMTNPKLSYSSVRDYTNQMQESHQDSALGNFQNSSVSNILSDYRRSTIRDNGPIANFRKSTKQIAAENQAIEVTTRTNAAYPDS